MYTAAWRTDENLYGFRGLSDDVQTFLEDVKAIGGKLRKRFNSFHIAPAAKDANSVTIENGLFTLKAKCVDGGAVFVLNMRDDGTMTPDKEKLARTHEDVYCAYIQELLVDYFGVIIPF